MGCAQSTDAGSAPGGRAAGGLNVTGSRASPSGIESKIVLLGDSGVGKSSMALRFCQGRFPPFHEVTIGAAFLQQIVRLPSSNTQLKLHIWDTGGQERFRAMAPLYYRDAAGAVVVYDVGSKESFESVKFWVSELRSKGPPDVRIAVAGNKADLPESDQVVTTQEAEEFCQENGLLCFRTSAMTGANIGKLFEAVAEEVYNVIKSKQRSPSGSAGPAI